VHLVTPTASDSIQFIVVAMPLGVMVEDLARSIHVYPGFGEARWTPEPSKPFVWPPIPSIPAAAPPAPPTRIARFAAADPLGDDANGSGSDRAGVGELGHGAGWTASRQIVRVRA
jgi:hypothetical protein